MTRHGWQIAVATASPDGERTRHYVVAIQDPEHAKAAIRRMGLADGDAKILVCGPVPAQTMTFLQAQPSGVYRVELVEATAAKNNR